MPATRALPCAAADERAGQEGRAAQVPGAELAVLGGGWAVGARNTEPVAAAGGAGGALHGGRDVGVSARAVGDVPAS